MPKTVVITGGSRGIGRACVERFAAEGYAVAFCCREQAAKAQELAAQLEARGYPALAMRADVSKEEDVATFFEAVCGRFGGVDALVNNAGMAHIGLMTDLTVQEWDELMAVNLRGVFLCCRAAIPRMLRRGGGSIVNLSSIWGLTGASCEAAYSASKAGIIGLTRALAKELGPSNIRVNAVAPGVISTEMNAKLTAQTLEALCEETPLGRLGTPEEVAAAVWFLASQSAGFITGQVLSPNGGFVI